MPRSPLSGGSDERILVVRTRYVGDTVMAIPFLRNLRARFPEARIDVLVEKVSGAVLASCPYKDELISWDLPRPGHPLSPRLATNVWQLARWLRSRRYSRAYVLKRALSAVLPVWLAGIPHRVGFGGEGRGALLSRRVPLPPHRHEVELFLDLLRTDGIAVDDARNENWVGPSSPGVVDPLLMRVPAGRTKLFVSPKSTSWQREWPEARWAALVARMVRERECDVVFCGSPAQAPFHRRIIDRAGPLAARHCHDWSSEVALEHLGALMASMDLCIGVDSGPVHLAASFGTPVVVLVGPTDPNHWCPWKSPSVVLRGPVLPARGWRHRVPRPDLRFAPGEATMESIPVAAVWDAALSLLPSAAAATPVTRAAG